MSRFFLGVDVGGTKTHALIANEDGSIVGFGQAGAGNHESVGYEGLGAALAESINRALRSAGLTKRAITAAGYGIAGFDWPGDIIPHRQTIEMLGIGGRYQVVNDMMLGLIAGTRERWGVVVGAGTGCNCRGRDARGNEGRVTGEGPNMGEYGGASELIRHAVQSIARAWTQRGPVTQLSDLFVAHVGASSIVDLLEGLCRGRYHLNASAAPLVFHAASDGDAIALEMLRWSGRQLADLAVGVIHQLEFETLAFEVVLTGSLFKGNPLIETSLREVVVRVAPHATFTRLTVPPVLGGVLLAMEQIMSPEATIAARLHQSASTMMESK